MSKRAARKMIANFKSGCTAKEFIKVCHDFSVWFDEIEGTELEYAYYALVN